MTPAHLLELLFAAGACAQLLVLGKAAWSWRKVRRGATETSLDTGSLARVRAFAGAKGMPPVLVSDAITVPVLVGWFRPAIILPRGTVEGSGSSLSMILCHEIAHFRRGDSLLHPLHWLLRIFYWWHPLVWLALVRLRREREIACDDFVLSQNFRATDYADLILCTAREMQAGPPLQAGALAMAARSPVAQRVTSILNPRVRRAQTGGWITVPGTVAALCLSWPLIAIQFQPADPPPAAFATAPSDPSLPQIKVSYRLVLIDLDTYQKNQPEMDAALATADPSVIRKLPGAYVLTTPSYITDTGARLEFADVKPMSFPTGFNADDYGNIIPSAIRSQNLGPTFEDVATLQPDNQSVTLQFKCRLTYFKQWNELPSGGLRPIFGKKVFTMTRTIRHGQAVWAVPGAVRYLPPDDLAANPFGGNWPSGKDTSPKRMFIFFNAGPATPEDRVELAANSPVTGAAAHP
jgi:hypothetical protein